MKRIIAASMGLLLIGTVLVFGTVEARSGFESAQENIPKKGSKNTNNGNSENSNQDKPTNKNTKKKPGRR